MSTRGDLYDPGDGVRRTGVLLRGRFEKLRNKSDDGDVDRQKAMKTSSFELLVPPLLEGKPPSEAREFIHRDTVERTCFRK